MKLIQAATSGTMPALLFLSAFLAAQNLEARSFRVNMVPNNQFSCNLCHQGGGGSPRNAFGLDVEEFVTPNGSQPFWDKIFNRDPDGDKIPNGEELGDPDGDGTPEPGAIITDPRQYTNVAPEIGGTASGDGFFGEPYSATFSAFDRNENGVSFSKVSGPTWLSVAANGLVSGTPPEGPMETVDVTIRATDDYSSPLTTDLSFSIDLAASFIGWQNLNFNLPGENGIAGPDQDSDSDDIPNAAEYALRLNPKQPDAISIPGTPTFDGSNQMQFEFQVRDDDPILAIQLETSAILPFSAPAVIDAVVTDPNESDGLETWTFTDDVSSGSVMKRFGRLKFELTQ